MPNDSVVSRTSTSVQRRIRKPLVGAVTVALAAGALALGWAPPASAATSYAVIATIPIGTSGDGLAIEPASGTLYVSDSAAHTVDVVDLTTNAVVDSIAIGSAPGRMALDVVAHRAYVLGGGVLTVIDTTTNTVVDTIGGFSGPIAVAADPGTHLVHVTNYDSQTIAVVDPTQVPATVTHVGQPNSRPWAIDVDPVTHKAYASTLFGGTVEVVAGTSHEKSIGGFAGPIQVTVDPSTDSAYVINNNAEVVSMIDTTDDTNAGVFSAGSGPSDIAVDQATHVAYVTNRNDDTVSVIDQSTHDVIGTVAVGDYPVAVEVDPATHRVYVSNGADGTISVIAPFASQEITFTSTVPSDATIGGSYAVSATGGTSGEPVTFSVDPATTNDACSVSDGTVSFDAEGTCVIAADQAGDDGHTAAVTATQQFDIDLVATTSTLALASDAVVHGEAVTATATISGTDAGTVQFTVDGASLGEPVVIDEDGEATSADLTGAGLAVGAHPVGAVFSPTDDSTYVGSSATPQSLTVSQAATTSTVAVSATAVVSTVTVTAPGSGIPTGTVQFFVGGIAIGSAPVTGDGSATLAHVVPSGSTQEVTAVYSGDAAFTGSSASTSRRDPVVTASVSSTKAPRNGWYSAPVTVTFDCEETSAELTDACPAPVTLSGSAAGQSVTRTIIAVDGGASTAVVSGINIDRVRPAVRITGVRAGATYFAAGPTAGCRASDKLSGVATCTVKRTTSGRRVVYVATATDKAGNRSSTRLVARITKVAISGAAMRNGQYVVHRGRTYTLLVSATKRPTYVYATPSPRQPQGGNVAFKRVGRNKWALGVTFTNAMSSHTLWNIGTRVGSRITVTTVRVVR